MKSKPKSKAKPKRLPAKFKNGFAEKIDSMMDGDYFDLVCAAALAEGYKFKHDLEFHVSDCRGKRFTKGRGKSRESIVIYHALCMGEFTDLQFE